jgi:hypothetical protein
MTEHGDVADNQPEIDPETPETAEMEGDDTAELDAYDLDDDGKVSLTENLRGELGMLDAQAEQAAEEPGLKGTTAKAVHRILDKLDND